MVNSYIQCTVILPILFICLRSLYNINNCMVVHVVWHQHKPQQKDIIQYKYTLSQKCQTPVKFSNNSKNPG